MISHVKRFIHIKNLHWITEQILKVERSQRKLI